MSRAARPSRLLPPISLAGFTLALLCGCGRDERGDFTAVLAEAPGIGPKSRVYWKGQKVGEVRKVRVMRGKFLVDARLDPKFHGEIRLDAFPAVLSGTVTEFEPGLELHRGTNQKSGILGNGATIDGTKSEDAWFRIWLWLGKWWLWLLGAALILALLLWAARKFLLLLLFIAAVAAALFVLYQNGLFG